MTDTYDVTAGARARAVAMGLWVLGADASLKIVARLGGCGEGADGPRLDAATAAGVWSAPAACTGSDLAGPSLRLHPIAHEGALLGLGAGSFNGFLGQAFGLGLLALATVITILVVRWAGRSAGDAQALALIWAGAIVGAGPRLVGDGRGLAELHAFGAHTGIGEFALVWGLLWLIARRVAEGRG